MSALEINYLLFKRSEFSKLMIIRDRKLQRGETRTNKSETFSKERYWEVKKPQAERQF